MKIFIFSDISPVKITVYTLLFGFFCISKIFAQGGGPPMITDDPGTPDVGGLEINLSFNSDFKKQKKEFEIPLLDINYGYNDRTQLKLEFPYLASKIASEKFDNRIGNVKVGIKYRFLDEEVYNFAFSIYPQVEISTESDGSQIFIFPVQLEKSFGKVVIGTDLGYEYSKDHPDYVFNGILLGYGLSPSFGIIGEIAFLADSKSLGDVEGLINFGIVYEFDETFKFISSFGTGIITPDDGSKTRFISFIGMQFNI